MRLTIVGFIFLSQWGFAADWFFLQMSDPQFGMYSDNRDFSQETANFEFAIATANRLHPTFVVVCGDLINQPRDPAQTAEYLRIAAKLDRSIPLYNVAGNHDVGNAPTAELLKAYREKFGPDYYTFRHGDFAGIVLDSSLIQHPDKSPDEEAKQEKWLESELEKLSREGVRRKIVFQHVPFFPENADEADQYFNIPKAARIKYMELFKRYSVHDVFAGHYHRNSYASSPTLRVITTGPVGRPIGPDPSGIRVVIVRESQIEHVYYGLGELPNQVDLGR
ncbi:MAG: metallophosphoesterase [Bryobacteraceae bacterium]|jgi:3',5'-cyclic AMP phosphodiesterase CpdA